MPTLPEASPPGSQWTQTSEGNSLRHHGWSFWAATGWLARGGPVPDSLGSGNVERGELPLCFALSGGHMLHYLLLADAHRR